MFNQSWTPSDPSSHGNQPVAAPPPNFGPPPRPYTRPSRKSGNPRPKLIAVAVVGAVILLVGGLTLAVTSGGDDTSTPDTATSVVASETSTTETSESAPKPAGHSYTIADYIRENKISETPIHRGDVGAPVLTLPTPPGWVDAGARTPAWAYSAIVNDAIPTDPRSVVTLISKLVGPVNVDRLLEFAPNELQNLAGYEAVRKPTRSDFKGFPAVELGGTYDKSGKRRAITQKTVVVEAPDSVFIVQINADALDRDLGALTDVNEVIAQQATITLP